MEPKPHANAEMLKAVADDTGLITFCKGNSGKWKIACPADIFYNDSFLCLPQHNKSGQCLHWLNGGDVQDFFKNEWTDCGGANTWDSDHMFMDEEASYRIKPKKEKRWIVYRNRSVYGEYLSLEDINDDFKSTGQLIEIEVEV